MTERGTVKWFNQVKNYGFITPDGGGKDVFFHRNDIATAEKTIEDGAQVEFEVEVTPKGKEAKNVRPIEG